MLKPELKKRVVELEKQLKEQKDKVKAVCEKAIEECCDDALEYVVELDKSIDLNITKKSYLSLDINLPISIADDLENDRLTKGDIKLTIDGKEVEVILINEIE